MAAASSQPVFNYHDQTKHHPDRYARSKGYLDWATQPNPFRSYEGVTPFLLPLLKQDPQGLHADLYVRTHNPPWDFTVESVAGFLELSLGLSAWKAMAGATAVPGKPPEGAWALRMNPSSGNLHPTEAYLILPPLERRARHEKAGLTLGITDTASSAGVFHYQPYLHALEPRVQLSEAYGTRLKQHLGAGFLVALTSIPWRESWKYGERALRYCQHDVGHALAALSFAANVFGWRLTYLSAVADADIAQLLGFTQVHWPSEEGEHPDLLCAVTPTGRNPVPRGLPEDWLLAFRRLAFQGLPNRLSPDHESWPLIDETLGALQKFRSPEASVQLPERLGAEEAVSGNILGAALIRQRRSAVAFNPAEGSLSRDAFGALLRQTRAVRDQAPFDLELQEPAVDLALFVHRVEGLQPGLYWYSRQPKNLQDLKRSLKRGFLWEEQPGIDSLYLLQAGDFRERAGTISCQQAIAATGVFSLGMIARLRPEVDKEPWRYRALFWETGMIGQVIYLEAEAAGLRGTGIGCFYDDLMHSTLGLEGSTYQSLYHFTVGSPLNDQRLTTIPAYAHLPKDRL